MNKSSWSNRKLWGFTGIVFAILASYKALQHFSFNTQAYDLGIRSSILYNIAFHGRVWDSLHSQHGFSGHFHPVSFLLAGFYRLWPDPFLLCLAQAAAVSAGLLLFIILMRRLVADERMYLALIGFYLVNPFLHNVLAYDFHPEVFAIPLVPGFFLLMEHDKPWLAALPAFALLALKEDMGLVLFSLGLYALAKRRWATGGLMSAIGLVWLPLALLVIIPGFQTAGQGELVSLHYQTLGSNSAEIISTLLRRPWLVFTQIFARPQTLLTIALLAASVGVFALARWEAALVLPVLAAHLISDHPHQMALAWQYSAGILPILFFASLRGAARIKPWLLYLALALAVPAVILRFPSPVSWKVAPARIPQIYKLMSMIPRDSSVSVSNNLAPHLVNRVDARLYPRIEGARYVLVDLEGNIYPAGWNSRYETLRESTSGYDTLESKDGLLLLMRRY